MLANNENMQNYTNIKIDIPIQNWINNSKHNLDTKECAYIYTRECLKSKLISYKQFFDTNNHNDYSIQYNYDEMMNNYLY